MNILEQKLRKKIEKQLYKDYFKNILKESNGTTTTTTSATQNQTTTQQTNPGIEKNFDSINKVKYWKELNKIKICKNSITLNQAIELIGKFKKLFDQYYNDDNKNNQEEAVVDSNTATATYINKPNQFEDVKDFKKDFPELYAYISNVDFPARLEDNNKSLREKLNQITDFTLTDDTIDKFDLGDVKGTIFENVYNALFTNEEFLTKIKWKNSSNTTKSWSFNNKNFNPVKFFYFKYIIENVLEKKKLEPNQFNDILVEIEKVYDKNNKDALYAPIEEFEFKKNETEFVNSLISFRDWVEEAKINSTDLRVSEFVKKIFPLTTKPGEAVFGPGKSEFIFLLFTSGTQSGGGTQHDIVLGDDYEIELKQGDEEFIKIQLNIKKEESEETEEDNEEEEETDIEEVNTSNAKTIYDSKLKFNEVYNNFQNNFKDNTNSINEIFKLSDSLTNSVWQGFFSKENKVKNTLTRFISQKEETKNLTCDKFLNDLSEFSLGNMQKYINAPPQKPRNAPGVVQTKANIKSEEKVQFDKLFSNTILGTSAADEEKILTNENIQKLSIDFLKNKANIQSPTKDTKVFILGTETNNSSQKNQFPINLYDVYDGSKNDHKEYSEFFFSPETFYNYLKDKIDKINIYNKKENISQKVQITKTDVRSFLNYFVTNVYNIQLSNLKFFKEKLEDFKNQKINDSNLKFDINPATFTKGRREEQKYKAINQFLDSTAPIGKEKLQITFKKYNANGQIVSRKEIISKINDFEIFNVDSAGNSETKDTIDNFLNSVASSNTKYKISFLDDISIDDNKFNTIMGNINLLNYLNPQTPTTKTSSSTTSSTQTKLRFQPTELRNILIDLDKTISALLDIHITIEETYSKGGKGALFYTAEYKKSQQAKGIYGLIKDSTTVVFPNKDPKYRNKYTEIKKKIDTHTYDVNSLITDIQTCKTNNVPFINKLGARDLNIDSNDSTDSKSLLEIFLITRKIIQDGQTDMSEYLSSIESLIKELGL